MRSILRRCRRGHTAAAAYTALFLALGGTAYAAAAITSEDIVDETIQSQDIAAQAVGTAELGKQAVTLDRMHDYSVNSAKVVDNSLSSPDIANGSLTHWDIADGTLTDRNVADRSLHGTDIADDSLTGRQIDLRVLTVSASSPLAAYPMRKSVVAMCPAGFTVLGGGGTPLTSDGDDFAHAYLFRSYPVVSTEGEGWRVESNPPNVDHADAMTYRLLVKAICANV
jgi:hypothetical protein